MFCTKTTTKDLAWEINYSPGKIGVNFLIKEIWREDGGRKGERERVCVCICMRGGILCVVFVMALYLLSV